MNIAQRRLAVLLSAACLPRTVCDGCWIGHARCSYTPALQILFVLLLFSLRFFLGLPCHPKQGVAEQSIPNPRAPVGRRARRLGSSERRVSGGAISDRRRRRRKRWCPFSRRAVQHFPCMWRGWAGGADRWGRRAVFLLMGRRGAGIWGSSRQWTADIPIVTFTVALWL